MVAWVLLAALLAFFRSRLRCRFASTAAEGVIPPSSSEDPAGGESGRGRFRLLPCGPAIEEREGEEGPVKAVEGGLSWVAEFESESGSAAADMILDFSVRRGALSFALRPG